MKTDQISEIGIDQNGRLYVRPISTNFSHIYRAAMEVHWDEIGKFLYSPKPRKWSYLDWYKQIDAAAKDEYGVSLLITEKTEWVRIQSALKNEIVEYAATNA